MATLDSSSVTAAAGVARTDRAATPSPSEPRGVVRRGVLAGVPHVFLVAWTILIALPLLWMLVSSVKTQTQFQAEPWGIPLQPRWSNYLRAFQEAHIGLYLANTFIVVGCAVVLTLLVSSMAAYVLARYQFPGSRFLYYVFVAGMTFPIFLGLVPLFFVVQNLGLLGTKIGLILVYTAYSLSFSIFFLTGFFRTQPKELAEAAFLDGCGHTGVFFRVMLPLARPGLISIGIFNVLGQWNQLLIPLAINPNKDNYLISQGLEYLMVSQGNYQNTDQTILFAGLILAIIPVVAVYLAFQRHVVAGMTAGAIK